MRRVTAVLAVLLIVSNALWLGLYAYQLIDSGISRTYREMSCADSARAYEQLRQLSSPLFEGKSTSEIRQLAQGIIETESVFSKPSENLFVAGNVAFLLDSHERVKMIMENE